MVFNPALLRLERVKRRFNPSRPQNPQKLVILERSLSATIDYKQALLANLRRYGTVMKNTPPCFPISRFFKTKEDNFKGARYDYRKIFSFK